MALEAFALVGKIALDGAEVVDRQLRRTGRYARQTSEKMQQAYAEQKKVLEPLRQEQMKIKDSYLDMALGSKTYEGSTSDLIREIQVLGQQDKKVTDQMMANNELAKVGFFQTIGTILARSTTSSKIAKNLDLMANPLYNTSKAGLAVSNSLEEIARQGTPALLALKMLGPQASMKDLNDQVRLINGGILRMGSVALAGAIGIGIMFSALHKASMENEKYRESFETMVSKVKQAMQPFVDVFSAVMPYIYDFISLIADMIIKFNNAHPLLSKMIAGFLLLIPVLVLILAPLAAGIGFFNGLALAFNTVWLLIAPLVTGLATISGPVLIIAGAIVGLVAVGVLLVKNWDTIKKKAMEVWKKVEDGWNKVKGTLVKFGSWLLSWTPFGRLVLTIIKNWEQIKKAFKIGTEMIKALWRVAMDYIKTKLSPIVSWVSGKFKAIQKAMTGPIESAKKTIMNIIQAIKNAFLKLVIKIPKPKLPSIKVTEGHKKIGKIDVPYPKISWNKKGGFFDRATLFGAGERGTEVLMPVENRKYMKPFSNAVAQNLAEIMKGFNNVMGGSIEIPLVINGREFSRAIISDVDKALKKRDTRQNGLLNRGNL